MTNASRILKVGVLTGWRKERADREAMRLPEVPIRYRNPASIGRSRIPYVCDDCYRGRMLRLPHNPDHQDCNERLDRRKTESSVNEYHSPLITAGV